ncbi:hypothetical protein [Clostridium sardiniense]|uniref:hypothetical protein n=1 Tax=Clostridium sardiniense TaxID=29369 RepID=UPI003D346A4F
MGNLIKINMYVERKEPKDIDMILLKENFLAYNKWLEKMNKADVIESYKIFLTI